MRTYSSNANREPIDIAEGAGITYFAPWGFSINEGAGPVNIHMQWNRPWCRFFFYIYVMGVRWSFCVGRKGEP